MMKLHYFRYLFAKAIRHPQLLLFMYKYGSTVFPYKFSLKYRDQNVDVKHDEQIGLNYVVYNGKRLYFKRTYNTKAVKKAYLGLLCEQDIESPHRYVSKYDCLKDYILLDVGAAEGIFALSVIEYVKELVLFECDNKQIEALEATFKPWKSKVKFINKYVSNDLDEHNITIDSYLRDKLEDKIFIKMDIEGYELKALNGAKETFEKSKNIMCSICTYHRKEDEKNVHDFLKEKGFQGQFTNGYMWYGRDFRKGVLRGIKTVSTI